MNPEETKLSENFSKNELSKEEINQHFQAELDSNNKDIKLKSNSKKNDSTKNVKQDLKVTENKAKQTFEFIDLFAGIGGIRLAFEPYGKCVFSSELDENAQKTYINYFGERPHGNIKSFLEEDIPSHDILLAGFPCQAFSIAGYRKGFTDTRGTLFFDIERILEHHKPKAFLLENVKGLVNHDGGETFRTIKKILKEKLNYEIYAKVLDSRNYANVPQTRERIFIVGFNRITVENYDDFNFPKKTELTATIHNLLDKDEKLEKYYYQPTHKYYKKLDEAIKSKDTIYQWRRTYVRENKSNACPTLTANMGTGGHNVPIIRDSYGIRKLTPKECLRFQGFPEEFNFPQELAVSHKYKQAGNSVTVKLVERIANQMMEVLQNEATEPRIARTNKKQSTKQVNNYSIAG